MSGSENNQEDQYLDDDDDQWSDVTSDAGDNVVFEHDTDAIQEEIVLEDGEGGGFSDDDDDDVQTETGEEDDDGPVEDNSVDSYSEHTDFVCKVAVFNKRTDGYTLVATGSGDDTAHLFLFGNGKIQLESALVLSGHTDTVSDVQFNFNGEFLATAGYDNKVGIWDTKSGKLLHFLEGPGDTIDWIVWHPKGNLIACGSADGTAWLWNAKTQECLSVFAGHTGSITCGAWADDGKVLVTGGEDTTVKIWNPKTSECVHTFSGDLFCSAPITCIATHPYRHNVIACGSVDGTAILLNIETQKILTQLRGHQDSVEFISFNPSQETNMLRYGLATCGMDGKIVVWDMNSMKPQHVIQQNKGIVRVYFHQHIDAHPCIVTCSADRTVCTFDIRTGEIIKKATGHRNVILDMVITDKYAFTASDDSKCMIFIID
ncbi:dynein assembly factor [Acrasis kona]|uniref:Dynein assembly factor n=1 Tax=Acrasis kona TaxID=1008807 RepID=A0AAW2ZQ53_9EUKA